jgi:site-specific DNA-methyltransferase (adenine-specific)
MELNKIYHGDCFELVKQIEDGSVNLIVTDPPYIVSKSQGGGSVNNIKKLNVSLQELDRAKLRDGYDIAEFSKEVVRIQGGRINAYFWCNKLQIPEYFKTYVENLGCKFEIICWHKMNALPTYSNKYLSDTEYCLYFHTGGFTHPRTYEDAKTFDIGLINNEDKKEFDHPTIKPINIIQRLIRNSSNEGDVIFDPFCGSGTTAIAAYRQNRHFIAFEIDDNYYEVANRRFNKECLGEWTTKNGNRVKEQNLFDW